MDRKTKVVGLAAMVAVLYLIGDLSKSETRQQTNQPTCSEETSWFDEAPAVKKADCNCQKQKTQQTNSGYGWWNTKSFAIGACSAVSLLIAYKLSKWLQKPRAVVDETTHCYTAATHFCHDAPDTAIKEIQPSASMATVTSDPPNEQCHFHHNTAPTDGRFDEHERANYYLTQPIYSQRIAAPETKPVVLIQKASPNYPSDTRVTTAIEETDDEADETHQPGAGDTTSQYVMDSKNHGVKCERVDCVCTLGPLVVENVVSCCLVGEVHERRVATDAMHTLKVLHRPIVHHVSVCDECEGRLTSVLRKLRRQQSDGVRLSANDEMVMAQLQKLLENRPPENLTAEQSKHFDNHLEQLISNHPQGCCFKCGVSPPQPN